MLLRTLIAALALPLPVHASLIAHYTFEDGTDSTSDVSATGATANLINTAAMSEHCRFVGTRGLVLSGAFGSTTTTDGAISSNSFNWGTSDVRTIVFWVKAPTVQPKSYPTMISLGNTPISNSTRFDLRLDAGKLRAELQGGGFTTSAVLNDDRWHHVAVVVPLATAQLKDILYYVDGASVPSATGTTAINTATGPLRIGDSYQDISRDFTGIIDEVRLYDEALDLAAIQALRAADLAVAPAIRCFHSHAAIHPGETANLKWDIATTATSAVIDQTIGDILSITTNGIGFTPVSPASDTTYTLTFDDGSGPQTHAFTVAVVPLPILTPPDLASNPGKAVLTASGLIPGRRYWLSRSTDLSTWPTTVSTVAAVADTQSATDATPPAGKAFYRLAPVP